MTHRLLPLALAASLLLPASAALAQQGPQPPRIVVVGEGESAVAPDMAILSLGVMREAVTAREALDGANTAMNAVIAALKASGVAERDLQTTGLQINPRYTYNSKPDGSQEALLVGYQVANTLTVRLRHIDKAGEVIDKAVTLGVNQNTSISFANDDPSKALTAARKAAVADAMDKARTLSEAAGVSLGRVLEISDQSYASPPVPIAEKAYARAADAVPIAAGENAYKVQVTVTFELR